MGPSSQRGRHDPAADARARLSADAGNSFPSWQENTGFAAVRPVRNSRGVAGVSQTDRTRACQSGRFPPLGPPGNPYPDRVLASRRGGTPISNDHGIERSAISEAWHAPPYTQSCAWGGLRTTSWPDRRRSTEAPESADVRNRGQAVSTAVHDAQQQARDTEDADEGEGPETDGSTTLGTATAGTATTTTTTQP